MPLKQVKEHADSMLCQVKIVTSPFHVVSIDSICHLLPTRFGDQNSNSTWEKAELGGAFDDCQDGQSLCTHWVPSCALQRSKVAGDTGRPVTSCLPRFEWLRKSLPTETSSDKRAACGRFWIAREVEGEAVCWLILPGSIWLAALPHTRSADLRTSMCKKSCTSVCAIYRTEPNLSLFAAAADSLYFIRFPAWHLKCNLFGAAVGSTSLVRRCWQRVLTWL